MVQLTLKVIVVLGAFIAWFGYVLPMMVSASDTLLVICGFAVTAFVATLGALSILQQVIAMRIEKEKQR